MCAGGCEPPGRSLKHRFCPCSSSNCLRAMARKLQKKPKKENPWHLTRSQENGLLKDVDRYARQVGQVMWAWNNLQGEYLRLFAALINYRNRERGTAVWHTIISDQAQRDMVEAVAPLVLCETGHQKRALSGILWSLAETRKLAGFRNYAAHVPMEPDYLRRTGSPVMPHAELARPSAVKTLNSVGYRRLYRLLRSDLLVLAGYVHVVTFELYGIGSTGTLPRRPRLLASRTFQAALPRKDPPKALKRKRRRRSSQA